MGLSAFEAGLSCRHDVQYWKHLEFAACESRGSYTATSRNFHFTHLHESSRVQAPGTCQASVSPSSSSSCRCTFQIYETANRQSPLLARGRVCVGMWEPTSRFEGLLKIQLAGVQCLPGVRSSRHSRRYLRLRQGLPGPAKPSGFNYVFAC